MPKQGQRAEVNTFVQGLITEASPLNFPANASVEDVNFELNRDGSRDRRLGMDYEDNYTIYNTTRATSEVTNFNSLNTFLWKEVNGAVGQDFLVCQLRRVLFIFDVNEDSVSANIVGTRLIGSTSDPEIQFSFASVDGKLIVADGTADVYIITYGGGSTFTTSTTQLKVRDVWGIQETSVPSYETDPTYRGGANLDHFYNLYNQSWGIPRKDSTGAEVDPVSLYNSALGVHPSNSEVVWTGLQYQAASGATPPFERIYTELYEDVLGADTKAPKGYFIIDFLRRGNSRRLACLNNEVKYPSLTYGDISSIYTIADSNATGASAITEFAGRVFYAGFNGEVQGGDARSPSIGNFVLFSQLVKSIGDINKCYQEGDPTSRDNSDIVDTDGGFVRVSGAEKIIALINLESHLVVIATNGVWAISGGSDFGFTAANYKVSKISSFGGISSKSVVVEGGRLFYWAEDGINVIGKDKFGELSVQNITQSTIQTFYDNIPSASKQSACGAYDPFSKKIRWIYQSGTIFSTSYQTKELVFDLVINAFYTSTISNAPGSNYHVIAGIFPTNTFTPDIRPDSTESLKYYVVLQQSSTLRITFAHYNEESFYDWKTVNGTGVDAAAYVLTGAQTTGDSAIEKQIPYLVMHFRRTEDGVDETTLEPIHRSSCLVRSRWSFANSVASGKWGSQFEAYRYRRALFVVDADDEYDSGFEIVTSKSKLRGRGKAFALYISTAPNRDCRIVGWNITVNGNAIA